MTDALAAGLVDVLAEVWRTEVEVTQLVRLSGGASRETWAFVAATADTNHDLVVQRERPGGLQTGGGMAADATLLDLARAHGVPTPEVVASGDESAGLGAAFVITRRLPGEALPRKLLRDPVFDAVRSGLTRQAGQALGRVHSMDVAAVGDLLEDLDQMGRFAELLDEIGEPHPAFELGLRWLAQRPVERTRTTIVHGDFRTGNLLVDPQLGLVAVLDWELAHLGDPVEDLGWFCCRAWRFGSPHRAGGLGSLGELLAGYAEVTGIDVDPDAVRWWEAMGTLKWGVMCVIQAMTHWSGVSRSVELAAIGRRVAETEWDLLELIAPREVA